MIFRERGDDMPRSMLVSLSMTRAMPPLQISPPPPRSQLSLYFRDVISAHASAESVMPGHKSFSSHH